MKPPPASSDNLIKRAHTVLNWRSTTCDSMRLKKKQTRTKQTSTKHKRCKLKPVIITETYNAKLRLFTNVSYLRLIYGDKVYWMLGFWIY